MLTLIGSPLSIQPCQDVSLRDLINRFQSRVDYTDFHYMPGTGGDVRPSQAVGRHPPTMSVVRLTQKADTDTVYRALRAMRLRPISEYGLLIFGSQYDALTHRFEPVAIGGTPWISGHDSVNRVTYPGYRLSGPGCIRCRGFYKLNKDFEDLILRLETDHDGWDPDTHFLVTDLVRPSR